MSCSELRNVLRACSSALADSREFRDLLIDSGFYCRCDDDYGSLRNPSQRMMCVCIKRSIRLAQVCLTLRIIRKSLVIARDAYVCTYIVTHCENGKTVISDVDFRGVIMTKINQLFAFK